MTKKLQKNENGIAHVLLALLIIVVIAVVGLVGWKVSIGSSKVSNEYINKYNQIGSLAKDIANNSTPNINGLQEKENAKDYQGAIAIVDGAINQNNALISKMNSLATNLSELKTLAGKISDPAVKDSALKYIGLLEENDGHVFKLLDYEKQLLNPLKGYYEDLSAGKSPRTIAIDQINSQINVEVAAIKDLRVKIDAANTDFAKLAKVKITEAK